MAPCDEKDVHRLNENAISNSKLGKCGQRRHTLKFRLERSGTGQEEHCTCVQRLPTVRGGLTGRESIRSRFETSASIGELSQTVESHDATTNVFEVRWRDFEMQVFGKGDGTGMAVATKYVFRRAGIGRRGVEF